MEASIIVAVISGACTLAGSFCGVEAWRVEINTLERQIKEANENE